MTASFGQGCTLALLAARSERITLIAAACAFTGLSSCRGASELRVNRSDTKTLSRVVAPHNANVAAALHHRLLYQEEKTADAAARRPRREDEPLAQETGRAADARLGFY